MRRDRFVPLRICPFHGHALTIRRKQRIEIEVLRSHRGRLSALPVEEGDLPGVRLNQSGYEFRSFFRVFWKLMRLSGSSRQEIEMRLRNGFDIEDTGEILDAILGPEG